jgi:hypothetical protein
MALARRALGLALAVTAMGAAPGARAQTEESPARPGVHWGIEGGLFTAFSAVFNVQPPVLFHLGGDFQVGLGRHGELRTRARITNSVKTNLTLSGQVEAHARIRPAYGVYGGVLGGIVTHPWNAGNPSTPLVALVGSPAAFRPTSGRELELGPEAQLYLLASPRKPSVPPRLPIVLPGLVAAYLW